MLTIAHQTVIPAKAGISGPERTVLHNETPAFAGVTGKLS
jgi:hypothetical protein